MQIDPPVMPQTARPNAFNMLWRVWCLSLLCMTIVSCAGSHTLVTTPTPDFSLTSTPASVTLTSGGAAQQITINAVPYNGFQQSVTVAISGLPSGVTANPATLTLTPGTPKSVALTAASSATASTASITLTGTSGTLSHAATVAATVSAAAPTPDFSLSVSPTSVALVAGATGTQVKVLATAVNSFTGNVSVAISGLPSGVTASPATLSLTPGTSQNVTLTAAANATIGGKNITFTGTSGTLTHAATLAATIFTATPPPDFSLSVSPTSLTLVAGATGTQIKVLATAVNSFTGNVSVAVSGLPSGVTASPATLSLTPGTSQNVTLTASASAATGAKTITFTGTSGTLTHAATVAATVTAAAPSPDFTLSITPTSLTLVGGQTGSAIKVLATPSNSFSSSVTVAISGLPSSVTASPATLTLTPGTSQNTTLTAASSATAAASSVTFTATSGSLTHTSTLALTVQAATGTTTSAPDITTYHNDIARDGLNSKETILNLSNVNSTDFGKIGFDTVDGLVDAEPLYLANITAGGNLRNVLYVATEHNSVYAFDADTGAQIWKTSITGASETSSDTHGCNDYSTEIGITSTPVIDRKQGPNGTIFVIGATKDASGDYHHRLHALDITTGAEIGGSPTEITASYPGSGENTSNGNVVFDPGQYTERASLLLLNGNIYTMWTSHCDQQPYTGWVMAYSESTFKQTQVLNLTPNGSQGAVWMSGDGPAADSSGNIYFIDANGTFDTTFDANGFPSNGDYGNAILKLSTSGTLSVADYFQTYDTAEESSYDTDLGSGGEVLLPDLTDASGTVRHLLIGAGKDSNIYLADRDDMGKFKAGVSSDNYIYQIVTNALSGPVFSTPAFFNGTVYYGAVNDDLRAFPITNARLPSTSSSQSAITFSYPGPTPSVSANGTQNGIVWALESSLSHPGVLHAYDATNLARELYNSTQATKSRDSFGAGNKFITPLVVNGKVYVGTATGVAIFGLLTP